MLQHSNLWAENAPELKAVGWERSLAELAHFAREGAAYLALDCGSSVVQAAP